LINIQKLSKKHGDHTVLNDLSAEVKKGEVVVAQWQPLLSQEER
jgi:ABC-type polar amino acid transport system ATPase subunit